MKIRNNHTEINKIPNLSGIYCCYNERDELVYVGRSKQLKYRLSQHQRAFSKTEPHIKRIMDFNVDVNDQILYSVDVILNCPLVDLEWGNISEITLHLISNIEEIERQLIQFHQPIYNREFIKMPQNILQLYEKCNTLSNKIVNSVGW